MLQISASEARRIALAALGFTDPRPSGRIDARHLRRVIQRLALLQIDSVNVLVRAHYMPLFARIGAYPRDLLDRLAYERRELFEYWAHEASLLPVELHSYLRWRMQRGRDSASYRGFAHWAAKHNGYVEDVLREVRERGPLAASELSVGGVRGGPWWGWNAGKQALEFLFFVGELTAATRRNFERVYDLTERVIPAHVLSAPTPSMGDAHRMLVERSARALGIGTVRDLADYFRISQAEARAAITALVEEGVLLPARVEGWKQDAFVHRDAKMPRRVRAAALVSPFDPLVWERARTERMFGFHYRIEIYTPAPKRVYGYYVLPFLLDEQIVARVDLKADRKASTLLVQGAFAEPDQDARGIAPRLADELRQMSDWLGLERITVVGRGDLSPALRRALR